MLDIAEEVLRQAGPLGHIGTEIPYCIIKNPEKYKHLFISNKWAAGKEMIVVDPSGYIKVCNHSPVRLIKYNELSKLKNHPYGQNFRNNNYIPKMCEGGKHLNVCHGGCREAANVFYGNINDNDPCFEKE